MTYVLGGTPRSGKSQVQRLLLERGIPGITTDIIRDGLEHSMPQVGIKSGMPDREKSEILWPLFREIILQRDNDVHPLLIEGTNFLPKYVSELKNKENVQIAFLGYADIDPHEKFHFIRTHPSPDGEWTSDMSDERLLQLVEHMIEISQYLKDECQKYDLPYFDTSHDFDQTIDELVNHFTKSHT